MRSVQWQLGILGTISAFAYGHRETKKNLCRDGRSQDLPNTDFQPAVRHLQYKKKQQCTHSTTNTHKMTTIHTRQLQQHTQDNYNNTHKTTTTIHTANQQQLHTRQLKTSNTCETNYNTTCTEDKNTQVREYCVQFIVIAFFLINSLTLSPQSFTSHHLLLL